MWIRWVLVPKSAQPGGFWHGRCAGLAREDVVLAVQVHLRMGYAPSNAEQKAVEAARARGLLSNKESANHSHSEPSYSAQRHDFGSKSTYGFVAHMHEIGYKNCRLKIHYIKRM